MEELLQNQMMIADVVVVQNVVIVANHLQIV